MKKYFYLMLSIIWMVIIFRFSSQTATDSTTESMFITERILRLFMSEPPQLLIDGLENLVRKLAHLGEYFFLTVLLYLTLRSFGLSRKRCLYAVLISAVYAFSDEVHQYFVPGRACRWYDVAIDTFGSFLGYYFCLFVTSLKNMIVNRKPMNKNGGITNN